MEKQERVIVVDDEPVVTHLVNKVLTKAGYQVIELNDSTRALEMVQKESPDLVLLDINMPGLNGFQVLEQIREASPIPVLMLTASHDIKSVTYSFDIGADDYIEKPFMPGVLAARVLAKLRMAKKH